MSPTIYLDTSVIFHLTDPPSPNPITRACQQLTQLWWHTRCVPNKTFISEYVLDDIKKRDPLRAMRCMRAIQHLAKCPTNSHVAHTGELLILGGGLKAGALGAGRHIACAAISHCEILLTWDCKNIANAKNMPLIRLLMYSDKFALPELVTPFEIMENCYENL
ncbi:PIN domain-containing protein [Rugamonas aquatica]|uniref:PIN domain-containing protein n=1 Tax=Rugamonas aquatica TaxID=2743357 RepID=A0A6A7N990_9BURK|nr:hypothetical protein [Rugamonas aquatica]MQA41432.1 hypothetical protein [Rugamonas aquatica]